MARPDSRSTSSRNGTSKTRPAPPRAARRAAAPSGGALGKHDVMPSRAPAEAAADGNIAKDVAETSLAATHDMGHWLSQWRQMGAQAMSFWGGALGDIEEEASQAPHFSPLFFLPFELMQRQANLFWSFFGVPLARLAPAPAAAKAATPLGGALPAPWRGDGAAGPGKAASGKALPADGAEDSVLDQMARAQSEWLAMTQRWIDSAASLPLKRSE